MLGDWIVEKVDKNCTYLYAIEEARNMYNCVDRVDNHYVCIDNEDTYGDEAPIAILKEDGFIKTKDGMIEFLNQFGG
jgi:hypothetical protein